ncbi:MAG: tRNA (adenosine(37)-N6)-threonylcarbamoyltransferase complex ATPase subunit type 1 TsaE [Balneolales bacterium]
MNSESDELSGLLSGEQTTISGIRSVSEQETLRIAEKFAVCLKPGDVVLLKGDLGAGKTHFIKGVACYFGILPEEVLSPTFSLIHEYQGKVPIYHLDCYRLLQSHQALEMGIEEYLYGDGISLIEWPEKIASMLPENYWVVELKHIDEQIREISIYLQV